MMPFGEVAARVIRDDRTYLNVDRLYTLWQAVESLPSAARAVAEVGVYRGGSAWFVAEALRRAAREMPFYVCDTFQGHVEVDETPRWAPPAWRQFTRVKAEKVAKYLRGFPFVRMVVGDIRDTAPAFANESAFGLVHLDVDVYPITRFCLDFFGPRMVPGGVIVMDDYGTTTCEGVKKAVDEFKASNPGFRVLHLLTGQAVVTKLVPGSVRRLFDRVSDGVGVAVDLDVVPSLRDLPVRANQIRRAHDAHVRCGRSATSPATRRTSRRRHDRRPRAKET